MDWIEVVADSVEEATDQALDVLGVDEDEAEIEVVEEPRQGLFGRVRGQAKVRARVVPVTPRPKVDRRERRRRGGSRTKGRRDSASKDQGDKRDSTTDTSDSPDSVDEKPAAKQASESSGSAEGGNRRRRGGRGRGSGQKPQNQSSSSARKPKGDGGRDNKPKESKAVTVTVEEQGEHVREFLEGLADAFGLDDAEAKMTEIEDDLVEVTLDADDEIGYLIGPKGSTISAVHEIAKAVVQRRSEGDRAGRFRLDIGGYRARRRDALVDFTRKVADKVKDEGRSVAMEPMGASDRKVIHDTINDIEGLYTTSEGEEPRRRVVIHPDED